MDGTLGDFAGSIWVDAGCELYLTPITLLRLKYWMAVAKRRGVVCFNLGTPESAYTKRELFSHFGFEDTQNLGAQIQATWFIVYGEKGKAIMREWLECILIGESKFNFDHGVNGEIPGFVEHRNDQSIFSMVCKKNGIKPIRLKPTPGRGSWKTLTRAFFHPIWTSRNRGGVSTIPKIYRIFGMKS
jgi:hypothetical protein